jgi:hypothetical protein
MLLLLLLLLLLFPTPHPRTVQQTLFPDNTYSHDSGGDPAVIPNLTFEQFQVGRVSTTPVPGSVLVPLCTKQFMACVHVLQHGADGEHRTSLQ